MGETREGKPAAFGSSQMDTEKQTLMARREFVKSGLFLLSSYSTARLAYAVLSEVYEFISLPQGDKKSLIEEFGLADLDNEKLRYFSVSDPIELHGRQLEMVGVAHTPQTLHFHQEEIEQEVSQAPFVILEYFRDKDRQLALPDVAFKTILAPENFYYGFFAGVGKKCAEQGKDVLVVNPQTRSTEMLEIYLAAGIPVGLAAISIKEAVEFFAKADETIISRREFMQLLTGNLPRWLLIKVLALGPSAAVWGGWQDKTKKLKNSLVKAGMLDSGLPPEEHAQLLSWYMQDWRDVYSAQGVDKAMSLYAQKIKPDQIVPVFHGFEHNAMKQYLLEPERRKTKAASYPHYDFLGENTIRVYSYDPQGNRWNCTRRIPY